jgi:hypothetical protein
MEMQGSKKNDDKEQLRRELLNLKTEDGYAISVVASPTALHAIIDFIIADRQTERTQAAAEALTKLRTRLDEPVDVSLFGFLPHNGEKMQEVHKLARVNVKQMVDEELKQLSNPEQPKEDSHE